VFKNAKLQDFAYTVSNISKGGGYPDPRSEGGDLLQTPAATLAGPRCSDPHTISA